MKWGGGAEYNKKTKEADKQKTQSAHTHTPNFKEEYATAQRNAKISSPSFYFTVDSYSTHQENYVKKTQQQQKGDKTFCTTQLASVP